MAFEISKTSKIQTSEGNVSTDVWGFLTESWCLQLGIFEKIIPVPKLFVKIGIRDRRTSWTRSKNIEKHGSCNGSRISIFLNFGMTGEKNFRAKFRELIFSIRACSENPRVLKNKPLGKHSDDRRFNAGLAALQAQQETQWFPVLKNLKTNLTIFWNFSTFCNRWLSRGAKSGEWSRSIVPTNDWRDTEQTFTKTWF